MKTKHFLSITDLKAKEILELVAVAAKLKKELKTAGKNEPVLDKKTLVMIFEKPSLRTRLSFEVAMTHLGGHAVYFSSENMGLGERESVADVAKIVSGMGDGLMARTYSHETVKNLAAYSSIPVINGLSDLEHPCQVLADLMTIWELKGRLAGVKLAYVGDGENNVAHSLCLGGAMLGMTFCCASPKGYEMKKEITQKAKLIAETTGARVLETINLVDALRGADIVYTDTWVSMGDEKEGKERLKAFSQYQVTPAFMELAQKDALFMHDLPAYRGHEVVSEVIDGRQSVVFDQAENRLHIEKALLLQLLGVL